jgi:hypothetical protein
MNDIAWLQTLWASQRNFERNWLDVFINQACTAYVHPGWMDRPYVKKNNANASGTADRWKAAFFRMYQLEFRDFHLPLLSAPTEVVKVCNILANILLVKPWKLIIGLHKTSKQFKTVLYGAWYGHITTLIIILARSLLKLCA